MVKLSTQNSKLGRVMNISLPPVIACRPDAPCHEKCYALKAYRQYPSVRAAWDHNLAEFQRGPEAFFLNIVEQLKAKRSAPKYFRWHVAGDIQGSAYLAGMAVVAHKLPNWHFLAYTKEYSTVNEHLNIRPFPKNLKVVMSQWPGLELVNPHDLPVATFDADHGTDCPGSCDTCKTCWHSTRGINFPAH